MIMIIDLVCLRNVVKAFSIFEVGQVWSRTIADNMSAMVRHLIYQIEL